MAVHEDILELIESSSKFRKLQNYVHKKYGLAARLATHAHAYILANQNMQIAFDPTMPEDDCVEVEVESTEVRDFTATVSIMNGADLLHELVIITGDGWDAVKEIVDMHLADCLEGRVVVDEKDENQVITIRLPNGTTVVRKVKPGQMLEIAAE